MGSPGLKSILLYIILFSENNMVSPGFKRLCGKVCKTTTCGKVCKTTTHHKMNELKKKTEQSIFFLCHRLNHCSRPKILFYHQQSFSVVKKLNLNGECLIESISRIKKRFKSIGQNAEPTFSIKNRFFTRKNYF